MATLVRICAVLAALCVALSLLLFVNDQASEGSKDQVSAIEGGRRPVSRAELSRPAPAPRVERQRERLHSGAREYVDDADDILLTPFAGIASDSGVWTARLVPGAIGLLLYGLGGLLLANALPQQRHETRDWREA